MRHIILGLSLLIPFSVQTTKAEDQSIFYMVLAVGFSFGLVDSIYKLAKEQKRKNDLLEKSLNQQQVMANAQNSIEHFRALESLISTHTTGMTHLVTHLHNNPAYQHQLHEILDKGVKIHQEISGILTWIEQLTQEQREQFAILQRYNVTTQDLEILLALKIRGFKDIPSHILDDVKKRSGEISSSEQTLKISPELLKKLQHSYIPRTA